MIGAYLLYSRKSYSCGDRDGILRELHVNSYELCMNLSHISMKFFTLQFALVCIGVGVHDFLCWGR